MDYLNNPYFLTLCLNKFDLPLDSFCIENGGIVITNPYAPTTKYIPMESLKQIVEYT